MRRAGSSAAAHLHRHRPERHPGPDMQRVLSVRERVAVDRAPSYELDVEVGWPVLDGRGNGRVCAGLLPRGLLKPAGHAARH